MQKFKTYGKTKFKKDLRSNDWDEIKKDESPNFCRKNWTTALASKQNENIQEEKSLPTEEVEANVSTLFENLKISCHSTPFATPVSTPLRKQSTPLLSPSSLLSYSFKCRRSVSFVSSHRRNGLRKKSHGNLSTSIVENNDSFSSVNSTAISLKEALTPALCEKSTQKKILNLCEQQEIIDIDDYVNSCNIINKIGEGSYGEVYEMLLGDESLAVKIVPVGSKDTLLNGYAQMTLDEIIPEMAISKKLSQLCCNENVQDNYTKGFIQLHRLVFCCGAYPHKLHKLWKTWAEKNESENDNPEIFGEDQLYIAFETNFGGTDLEKTNLKSVKEAFSILQQMVTALACAETMFQFEHRDLHHGNILLKKTKEKTVKTVVGGDDFEIDTNGIEVSIIDFTMARLITDDCVLFTDLADEEVLFEGSGDIQFEVYRKMRKYNDNEWESFNPYTNVLWIHYVTEKLIYKLKAIVKLKKFLERVLEYSSAKDILQNEPMFKK